MYEIYSRFPERVFKMVALNKGRTDFLTLPSYSPTYSPISLLVQKNYEIFVLEIDLILRQL